MCGIIGVFGRDDSEKLVIKGLSILKNRGRDASNAVNEKGFSVGHCLHAVVGRVEQPFKDDDLFASNCEIYNWEELDKEYSLGARNDSEALFRLLKKKGVGNSLKELDGVYAFAYLSNRKLYLARDIIGVKPLWYSHADGFSFASEKKALEKLGMMNVQELNPRKILEYDLEKDSVKLVERNFFKTTPELAGSQEKLKREVKRLLKRSVKKRVPNWKFGLLFSGGIDSTAIAMVLKELGHDFTCYTAVLDDPGFKKPEDLKYARKVAKELNLKLKVVSLKLPQVESYLKKIVPLIEDSNVVKNGVALPFYAACEQARKDGCKVVFSGLGSEEIFAGYQRHRESLHLNRECVSGLLKMYERDLYRDDVVTMHNQLELRLPFLDKHLVMYALRIPAKYKMHNDIEKYILRLAAKDFGINDDFVFRKKKAAQYGSNFHKAIQKLTNKSGYKRKSDYLKTFYPAHNVKLGALLSSGKDSIYALYTMLKQNYSVDCLITIDSENPDSYMFHTPTIELARLQSKAMGIPIITHKTTGEKEKELEDLKEAIRKAKKKYSIQGIVTGALFSNYQRERVERICDELSLKIFHPLWHINQETEMRKIIREGFKFIMTKVAAEGLDKSWLGREITNNDVDKLASLKEKIGLNIAGEGGEFETLVLNGPIFSNEIKLSKTNIIEEDENTATLVAEKAELNE